MMEVHKTQCPDNYFPESEVVLLIYPLLALQYLSIGQYWHEQNSVERYLGDVYALLISKLKYLIEIDIRPRVFILLTISKFEFIFHLVIKAQTIVAILSTGSGWVFLYFGVHKFDVPVNSVIYKIRFAKSYCPIIWLRFITSCHGHAKHQNMVKENPIFIYFIHMLTQGFPEI